MIIFNVNYNFNGDYYFIKDIDREVEFFTDACSKYQRAIIR